MRFWEVDLLKGIAIILVMLFHLVFDLAFFAHFSINLESWLWWSIARAAASLFILLSGLSLSISFQKSPSSRFFPKLLMRSFKLLAIGALISLATWLFVGEGTIVFGILHFLAVAPLCAYLFIRYPLASAGAAFLIFLCTPWMQAATISVPYFVWLGLQPVDFYSLDHFPLAPWLGVYLLGLALGRVLYPQAQRRIVLPNAPTVKYLKALSFLGQHTLVIYLGHQPIFLAIFYLLGYVS
jgi:uncharacterized membrane protein